MKFPEHQLAHRYLDGLTGVEVGGASHNPFGLNTINVDRFAIGSAGHKPYADEQMRLCGEVMPVDVVAPGDKLPFADKSYDFVISSHVIEHFYDPIAALAEWARVARKYIFIICPQPDALESDRDKPLTTMEELRCRPHHIWDRDSLDETEDKHWSRWTVDTFCDMCVELGYSLAEIERVDSKVGNGFTVIIKID